MNSIVKSNGFVLLLLWIMTMITLYIGVSVDIFLLGIFILSSIYFLLNNRKIVITPSYFLIFGFILYYIFLTTIFAGNVLKVSLLYLFMPFSIYAIVSKTSVDREKILGIFKNFIGLTAIYGIFEYIEHFNYMVYFVRIEPGRWIDMMNKSSNYYVSSIFLHYTYFAYVLLIGFSLSLVFPYKNKLVNFLYRALLLLNIVISQSRIIWIALLAVIFMNIIMNSSRTIHSIKAIFASLSIVCLFMVSLYLDLFEFINTFISKRFSSLFKYGLAEGSLGQRVGTLINFDSYFNNNTLKAIFGAGYGGIQNYLTDFSYFAGYSTADSLITIFLVETGIVGLILFILSLIPIFIRIIMIRSRFSKLALYILIGTLITSLTIDFSANAVILILFYIVIVTALVGMEQDCVRLSTNKD